MGQSLGLPPLPSGGGAGAKPPPKPQRKMPAPATRFKNVAVRRKGMGEQPSSKLPQVTPRQMNFLRLLKLNRVHDWLLMEEEVLKREQNTSKRDKNKEFEAIIVDLLRGSPMGVGNVDEIPDDDHCIVTMEGSKRSWYIPILSVADKDLLRVNSTILTRQSAGNKTLPQAIVGVMMDDTDAKASILKLEKAPNETYADVGGLETQIQELKEAVELPLSNPESYEEMGIEPPKGVILYGPPGTGKTLLAKAVANKTSATFIRLVGSQLVQKGSGDGPKLVRDLFRMARDQAPSIVFLDEIDAVGSKRYDTSCGGEKEVQRTMLELLNQLDGFDKCHDVKVVMATNRIESLDPALIRPGRIDRKIEIPLPDERTKCKIFELHTSRMTLAPNVSYEQLFSKEDTLSGADIKAVCTEAGMLALRDRRKMASSADFKKGIERVLLKKVAGYETMYI